MLIPEWLQKTFLDNGLAIGKAFVMWLGILAQIYRMRTKNNTLAVSELNLYFETCVRFSVSVWLGLNENYILMSVNLFLTSFHVASIVIKRKIEGKVPVLLQHRLQQLRTFLDVQRSIVDKDGELVPCPNGICPLPSTFSNLSQAQVDDSGPPTDLEMCPVTATGQITSQQKKEITKQCVVEFLLKRQ